jgi:two-component system, sensor histidine kinase
MMTMPLLKTLSIRRKLLLLAMITSTGALLVTATACMTFDVWTFREKMTRDLKISAEVIGANCSAALAFGDGGDARQTLASFRGDPHIIAACIYGPEGKVFATYARAATTGAPAAAPVFPPRELADTARFTAGALEVFHVVSTDGKPAGTLYLRSDLGQLQERIARYAMILIGMLAASTAIAFLLASRLTRLIATPIHHLAETARAVSAERNYTVRAIKSTDDEIGLLTDGFNEMLDQIQQRDTELAAHRDHLEEQVAHRTEELQRINAQLTGARDRAEAANEAKSNFLANMSHEIRTPMTAIIGYADMMLEPDQTLSDRQDCLQVIRRNARHLVELINDILDISKIEAEKMTVERVRANFPQLIVDVVSLMRPRAAEKELDLRMRFEGSIPEEILTDPTRLRQIVMNLTANAIKFTERGFVELSIRCEPGDGKSLVQVIIRDTGIGMTAEQVGRLFQPFMQADNSMTRRFGGTGLGLVISKRLARLLGGDIAVSSAAGVGSTFTITLDGGPLDDVNLIEGLTETMVLPLPIVNEAEGAEPAAAIRLDGARVLLAEDGPDNQRLISAHLRRAGADVTIAENGRIAVDLVRKESFDLIVMDMQMPELDGYGAASELRRRNFVKPIIALTAHAMADDRDRCIRAGCTDYLTKPIDKQVLLGAVRDYLARSRAESPAAPEEPAAASLALTQSIPATPAPARPAARPVPAPAARPAPGDALISQFRDDPDMSTIIEDFVNGLPAQVARIHGLLEGRNLVELRRTVHQLKGAGGGYGFPQITEFALQAENELKASADADLTASVQGRVDELVALIRRVSGYDPAAERPATERPAAL